MIEIQRSRVPTTIGSLGLMAASLLNPSSVSTQPPPPVQSFPVVLVYPASANTYGEYASLFLWNQLPLGDAAPSLVSFYANLLAKQERLGREFEQVLFDNLWDLYAR
jgi:hypothetical protein